MDTERFNYEENRYEDSITDILQMMGNASAHTVDKTGHALAAKCIIYCQTHKKEYYLKFLKEPLPIESSLDSHFHDILNAEIVSGTIESNQSCVDWITWTFMYRRIS